MAAGYINERTRTILDMFLASEEEITLDDIAKEIGLTKRSVYHEIDKANDWLKSEKLPLLEIRRGRISPMDADTRLKLDQRLSEGEKKDTYLFSPSERVKIIICRIISSREPIYIEQLQNTCEVSRNTIFTDLQAVIAQLRQYDLGLSYDHRTGYAVDGDAVRVRALYFLYFSELSPIYEGGHLDFIDQNEIKEYFRKLKEIETELGVTYVDGNLQAIAALLPIMEMGKSELYFPDLDRDKIRATREFALISSSFSELAEDEKIYLCLHLLGSRLTTYDTVNDGVDASMIAIAKALTDEFERKACVVFEDRDRLIEGLARHIQASRVRYQFGIQIGNPMAEDIRTEYPEIFGITKSVVGYLEQQMGVRISDSEVAYLALHFGSSLASSVKPGQKIRILVVCRNGIATSNMIRHELLDMLPFADIVGVEAADSLQNAQERCDLIVSSVRITAAVPVIQVNPIMNDFDRQRILNHPLIRGRASRTDVDALYESVKSFVPEKSRREFREALRDFFLKEQGRKKNIVTRKEKYSITDFLVPGHVFCADAVFTWEQAIRFAAQCLVREGSVTEDYPERIIQITNERGPYMMVTQDVFLAHAKPEDGVNRLDLSMALLKRPVDFGEGRSARVILVLAAVDQETHLPLLGDIRRVFRNHENVDKLCEMERAEDAVDFFKEILKS